MNLRTQYRVRSKMFGNHKDAEDFAKHLARRTRKSHTVLERVEGMGWFPLSTYSIKHQ